MSQQSSLFSFVRSTALDGNNQKRSSLPKLRSTAQCPMFQKRPKLSSIKKLDYHCNQMIIDAGQKKFGAEFCASCGMSFDPTFGPDVDAHDTHHYNVLNRSHVDLHASVLKHLILIQDCGGGSIYRMEKISSNKTVKEFLSFLTRILNRELNSSISDEWIEDECARDLEYLFLYVHEETKNKRKVVGCLVSRQIEAAFVYRSDSGPCTGAAKPAKLGVNRIWISNEIRRRGLATRMLDCARCNSLCGLVIPKEQVAFSDLTEDGLSFARSYFGSDSFLVHFSFDNEIAVTI